jgi:hypothetical protein
MGSPFLTEGEEVTVTPFIDDDAVDVCRRYGIEVYSI